MAYPSDPVELRGMKSLPDKEEEITRLLGFALFNLNKGNLSAVDTLVRKAYKANSGREWDE